MQAASYLKKEGFTILEQNYRCRRGEVDLIAEDRGYLVFVEVKYRSGLGYGTALEAVDYRKQIRISRAAAFYLMEKKKGPQTPCRFDVLGITEDKIEWIKNAFDYHEW